MKKQNKQKGITLVALVITIIVLLILAGITINLTLGQDGILKRAQEAGRNYQEAANAEREQIAEFTNEADKIIANLTGGTTGGGNTPSYETLASKAKPGDYVEYDGGNGYTKLWQVLYNDGTYGLQIISADTVTDSFTLGSNTDSTKAKSDYNNAVSLLNTECRKYVNTSYATSGRCVGSNPLSPDDPENMDTVKYQWNNEDSGLVVGDEEENYLKDYNAMKAAKNQSDSGIHNVEKTYWLASRYVNPSSSDASFYVRYVNSSGNAYNCNLWYVTSRGGSSPNSYTNGVRPVITLKSGIQTSSGDGSVGNAFKLVLQ